MLRIIILHDAHVIAQERHFERVRNPKLQYLDNAVQALRQGNKRLAGHWVAVAKGCHNPEPDNKALALYVRAKQASKWKDAWYPKWLKEHFRAVALPKPFEPDYRCTTAKCPKGHRIPEGCTITVKRIFPRDLISSSTEAVSSLDL